MIRSNALGILILFALGCGGRVEVVDELAGMGGNSGVGNGGSAAGSSASGSGASAATPSCSLAGPETFASSHDTRTIVVDDADVYWTDWFSHPDFALWGRPKAGGESFPIASGSGTMWDLAQDETYLYLATTPSGLLRVDKSGGTLESLSKDDSGVTCVGVDASHVYYSLATAGEVKRIPKNGGAAETLVTGMPDPDNLAVDDTYVYWINESEDAPAGASLMRMAKSGGTPLSLATGAIVAKAGYGRTTQDGLAVTSESVVWIDEGGGAVYLVAKQGGSITTLMTGLQRPTAVVAFEGHAYVTTAGNDNYAGRGLVDIALGGGTPRWILADNAYVPTDLAVDALHAYFIQGYATAPIVRTCR